jgi:hypothetical protein
VVADHLARLTSLQGPYAGAWVSAVPVDESLRLETGLWQVAALVRLGLPVPSLAAAPRCCGGDLGDPCRPQHTLREDGAATVVHHAVRDAVAAAVRAAGLACDTEPRGVLARRPDWGVRDTATGRVVCGDLVVADPQAPGRGSGEGRGAETRVGAAAASAEAGKARHYRDELRDHPSVVLFPLAVETTGCVGQQSRRFLQFLGLQAAARLGLSGSLAEQGVADRPGAGALVCFFSQRLGVALQRAQAAVLSGRAAAGPALPGVLGRLPVVAPPVLGVADVGWARAVARG